MKRLAATVLLLATIACGITGPNEVTLHAQGTVTDQATGQPVSGALVQLYPPSLFFGSSANIATTSTDLAGHYAISASVGSACTGNGFGYVVAATSGIRESDAAALECSGSNQIVNLTVHSATP